MENFLFVSGIIVLFLGGYLLRFKHQTKNHYKQWANDLDDHAMEHELLGISNAECKRILLIFSKSDVPNALRITNLMDSDKLQKLLKTLSAKELKKLREIMPQKTNEPLEESGGVVMNSDFLKDMEIIIFGLQSVVSDHEELTKWRKSFSDETWSEVSKYLEENENELFQRMNKTLEQGPQVRELPTHDEGSIAQALAEAQTLAEAQGAAGISGTM